MNPILKLVQQVKDAEGVTLASVIKKVEDIRVGENENKDTIKRVATALITLKKEVDAIPLTAEVKKLQQAIKDAEKRVDDALNADIKAVKVDLRNTEDRLRQEIEDKIPDIVTITEKVTEVAKELDESEIAKVLKRASEDEFVKKIRDIIEGWEGEDRLDATKLKNLPQLQVLNAGGGSNLSVFKDGNLVNSSTRLNFTGSGVTSVTNTGGTTTVTISGAGGGYTNLTEFVDQTAWRVFYSNSSGDVTELALGADGTFLKSNGATSAPSFSTPAGSGDVSKVGTPVNNQVGVWTGDGTIEGTSGLTYDGSALGVTGNITVTGTVDGRDVATDGSKLDGIEANADVTDATNVEAAGALMDSEVTNLAAVKAFDPTDYTPAPEVVSGSLTAVNRTFYVNVASATYTDPTPVEGEGFAVFVRNGTATVGGTGYSTAGTIVHRIYHSGAWANYVYQVSSTFATAAQGSLADTAVQPGDNVSDLTNDAGYVTTSGYVPGGTDVALADGGTGASLTDPNDDRIMFWDDSAGAVTWLTASTGLTISGTNMTVLTSSSTQTGIVELATDAETVTGTDTARATTPANISARLAAPGTIGGTTPGAATFTTVTTTGNIELGNASDTTLSRSAAGVLAVEGAVVVTKPTNFHIKAITIESPTASEDITLFFTDDAITITQLNAVSVGTTPSVTYTIRHGSDRSAAGNEVVTSGSTTTSTTTGDEVTSFNDATIPAGSWVWLETTATSGTVTNTNITIEYTVD